MFVLVIAFAFVVGLTARLVCDLRHDRPTSAPRSHWHELDPHTARVRHLA